MASKYLFLVFLVIGAAAAQTDESISEAVDNLPAELQGKVDKSQVEDIKNKTTQVFKEKCDKNGGADAFNNVEAAAKTFVTCISSLVDQKVLEQEIEAAKPEGKVDEVFKKYCDKKSNFEACFYNVTEAAKPCFDVDEKKHLKTVYNITEQLAQFVCFKGGDRIALFIAEGGPDCFKSKQEEIQNCFNKTLGGQYKLDPSNLSMDSLPTIAFDEKECGQLTQLQLCVVSTLETCEQPTSANIVESLFKFARKSTPCSKYPDPTEAKPGAAGTTISSLFTVVGIYTLVSLF